ncbi:MAG: hypothetical protein ACI9JU_002243, partial [Pseudohongiellaceae bacterium]
MQYKLLCKNLLSISLLLIPAVASSHGGNLDLNGGHYYGRSYHCHMSGCAMPDTFSIGR